MTVNFIFVKTPKTYNIKSPVHGSFSVLAAVDQQRENYIVYGFLPYWKLDNAKFIQTDKLTDIAYFGLKIEGNGEIRRFEEPGVLEPGYNNWKNNPELSNLISRSKKAGVRFALTIISHEDEVSDEFLNCTSCWQTLINEIGIELEEKNITDVNLDFEYFGYTDLETALKYSAFAKQLNDTLDARYNNNSKVIVSTFADSVVKPRVTHIDTLAKYTDGLFVMAYDFHRPASATAGPIAPLGGMGDKSSYDVITMLKAYLSTMSPDKIILGVPYYGYNWLIDEQAPYANRVEGNDYIGYSESQPYETIVYDIKELNSLILWDNIGQTPYYYYRSPDSGALRVVHFENKDSLKMKYGLVKQYNLGGVGLWALGYDGQLPELWDLLGKEFGKK